MYSVETITPPSIEPVTLAEAKLHLRVDISDDDTLITNLITAARRVCETMTRRAFLSQVLEYRSDSWFGQPGRYECGRIRLPRPPMISITSVKYYDSSNVLQTLDPSAYRVQAGTPGIIEPVNDWPSIYDRVDAIAVRYTAGYGTVATSVPGNVKAAMKLMVGHWYENREMVAVGTTATEVPGTAKLLLSPEVWGPY